MRTENKRAAPSSFMISKYAALYDTLLHDVVHMVLLVPNNYKFTSCSYAYYKKYLTDIAFWSNLKLQLFQACTW